MLKVKRIIIVLLEIVLLRLNLEVHLVASFVALFLVQLALSSLSIIKHLGATIFLIFSNSLRLSSVPVRRGILLSTLPPAIISRGRLLLVLIRCGLAHGIDTLLGYLIGGARGV